MRSLSVVFCLALGIVSTVVSFPVAALAQSAGSVTVTVTDTAGKPLGDARVTVTGANGSRTSESGPDGRFSVSLPPGAYSITVSSAGFQSSRNDNVFVVPGQNESFAFTLANATLQSIGSTGRTSTSINTSSAANNTVSSQTFLDQGQNQVMNVLDQIPGVEINRMSSNAPGANSAISIRGAEPYESQILIDGHPVVSSANGAAGFNSTFINSLLLGNVQVNKGPGNMPNTIEDAVGGSLNFETPSITAGPTGTAVAGYDSFNGNYFGLRASDTFGKLGLLVGIAGNTTPGYLTPQTVYGGNVSPTVTAGTAYDPHIGVVDFGYRATQDFSSQSQLAKLSYNFSPHTSLLFTQYSTQTLNDETGTNLQDVYATIVPCLGTPCSNYTSTANQGLIGQVVPINKYAPYPDTSEFDNEPIYSAEFRTVVGPGSLLARYYTGTIDRVITQTYSPVAVIPCATPACPNGDNFNTSPPTYSSAAYYGEPYVEDTIDVLHGFDAQYSVPFGADTVTLGFDRHVDTATFGEYDPTLGPPTFTQGLNVQSIAYSIRDDLQLTPKLLFESGEYLSNTSYVGTRFDPRGGFVYRVNPDAAVRASYGSAYVAPYYSIINPQSYVSSGTLELATGQFKPETSSGYDVGSDVKLGRDNLISTDLYLTNVFNRYAAITAQQSGTFNGKQYSQETQEGNQAVVREEGLEFQFMHEPRVGLGFHSAVDLLRDYAYDQASTGVKINSIFSATPGNYVQLPQYPYSKIQNDLFYTFRSGLQARFSSTSYGANNAFGQSGFTEFDSEIRTPLAHGLVLNIGATNVFDHDNYKAGGIYDGGYTFQSLAGTPSYTTLFYVQPRTLYIQLQRSVGPGGPVNLPTTSL
ncbi:MAG TPA: TonB-dependent receptor [Candidatus Limnocylindria bacterium]|nr:TonB-dependent receptor [Candidatus Limnocylindria bacterium]